MAPNETMDRLLEVEMGPALLDGGAREQWEAISDLDAFFRHVYSYFHERGMRCIVASRVISLLVLGFTMMFSVWLVECMNWEGLLYACVDETSCATVRLVRHDAFRSPSPFLILYLALFSLYWLWSLAHFLWDLCPLLEMQSFFRNKLRIDDQDLQAPVRAHAPSTVARRTPHPPPQGSRVLAPKPAGGPVGHGGAARGRAAADGQPVHRQGPAHRPRHRQPHPAQGELHGGADQPWAPPATGLLLFRLLLFRPSPPLILAMCSQPVSLPLRAFIYLSLFIFYSQPVSLLPSFNVMTKTLEWNLYATPCSNQFISFKHQN